jgi:subtilisin family serine protease
MRTVVNEIGRVVALSSISDNVSQSYVICVKNEEDWEEIHNYIINENEIDGIPNRKIECISELPFSSKRSVYNMSFTESEVLKLHPKIEWVEKSSMHNPIILEQRKLDEEFDRHTEVNRFKINVTNLRGGISPGVALTFTQWGLYRHQSKTNNFGSNTTIDSDIQYSLSGKDVDIVIMDTGVRWDHPEFLKPGYNSVPVGVSTFSVTRVRDILLHGPSEYGFSWSANGLTAPGSGILANYTEANALNSNTFNGSWHGSHVAGTVAGNQFGLCFNANIWSIACVDRSDLGWAEPSDGFDYIRVWHKNKPVNPRTGLKNPTVVNCSWGHRQFVLYTSPYSASFRGINHSSVDIEADPNYLPAVYFIPPVSGTQYYQFTTRRITGQTQVDELLDDFDCQNMVLVCSAGNSGDGNGKQDLIGGVDYNNEFTSGSFFYSSGYDNYYCRPGTPAIGHYGLSDAVIKVGSLDSSVIVQSGITSERKSFFSNTGPSIDIWAAGSNILSPYSVGFNDPRNGLYYNTYLSGTSMAAPNVTGVIGLHLESRPKSTRTEIRNWLLNTASVSVDDFLYDPYKGDDAVGINSVSYWSDPNNLRDASHKVLYNPYANNIVSSMSGVNFSGITFTQV